MTERTKTPELGPCPQCGRTQLILARMYSRGLRRGFLPVVSDDANWAELEKDHAPDCYWWATRGMRALPKKEQHGSAKGEKT